MADLNIICSGSTIMEDNVTQPETSTAVDAPLAQLQIQPSALSSDVADPRSLNQLPLRPPAPTSEDTPSVELQLQTPASTSEAMPLAQLQLKPTTPTSDDTPSVSSQSKLQTVGQIENVMTIDLAQLERMTDFSGMRVKVVEVRLPVTYFQERQEGALCPCCGIPITRRQSLNEHLMVSHLDKPESSEVVIGRGYERVHTNKITILAGNGRETSPAKLFCNVRYHCPEDDCIYNPSGNKYFMKLKFLKQHYEKTHVERQFICSKCAKKFMTKKVKNEHELICGFVFQCNSCDAEYKELTSLQTHARRTGHKFNYEIYRKIIEDAKTGSVKLPEVMPRPVPEATPLPAVPVSEAAPLPLAFSSSEGLDPYQTPYEFVEPGDTSYPDAFDVELLDDGSVVIVTNGHKWSGGKLMRLRKIPPQRLVDMKKPGESPGSDDVEVIYESLSNSAQPSRINFGCGTSTPPSSRAMIPILPKPSIEIPACKTDSEMQTDPHPRRIRSASAKRRLSASTQTQPTKISTDTQTHTPRKRRRRSFKASMSIETQTTKEVEINPLGNHEESAKIPLTLNSMIESSLVENNATTSVEYNQSARCDDIFGDEFMERCWNAFYSEFHSNGTKQLPDQFPTAGYHSQSIPDNKTQPIPMPQLSTGMMHDMSTSPMHFPEELDLFEELIGTTIQTQTDFVPELSQVSDAHAASDFTHSETQTADFVQHISSEDPLSLGLEDLDEFNPREQPFYNVIDECLGPETRDGETQTQIPAAANAKPNPKPVAIANAKPNVSNI